MVAPQKLLYPSTRIIIWKITLLTAAEQLRRYVRAMSVNRIPDCILGWTDDSNWLVQNFLPTYLKNTTFDPNQSCPISSGFERMVELYV